MLHTHLTRAWGLRHPILNASMTPAAGGALARAVTRAGGLGMIGVNETWDADELRHECAAARAGDPAFKFGIGFFGWALEQKPHLLDVALAQKPFLVCISFTDVAPYARRVLAAGVELGAQVQSRKDAARALAAGVNVVIAQGTEAGGHTGDVSTLVMLQIALSMTEKPVLAAGGIATAAGLAAVLAAGAAGAWIGSPFLMATEANVAPEARERIAAADETQTVLTSLFDRLQGFPWPERFKGRALQNDFTRRWHGREAEAAADAGVNSNFLAARANADYAVANVYAGQSAGLLAGVRPAGDIVEELGSGAERLLRKNCRDLLGPV